MVCAVVVVVGVVVVVAVVVWRWFVPDCVFAGAVCVMVYACVV